MVTEHETHFLLEDDEALERGVAIALTRPEVAGSEAGPG